MKVTKLTNVDFIILYILGQGGSARRIDIIKAYEKFRPNAPGVRNMYFARYQEQSPFYTFDKKKSAYKKASRSYMRGGNDAKVSMWKLTPRGLERACWLRDQIIQDSANTIA